MKLLNQRFLKSKNALFSFFLVTGLLAGIVFAISEEPGYNESELVLMSELSEADIDQMAAVLAEMQSAKRNIE